MMDFIRTYGKLAGLFAAAAFVLSSVTGIAARNPVGTIVLRAALLAVLFCGLGVGLQFVVKKFLPELTGASDAPADERAPGSQIDIVLPEEGIPARSVAEAEAGEIRAQAEEAGPVESLEEAGDQETAVLEETADLSQVDESAESAGTDEQSSETAKQSGETAKQSGETAKQSSSSLDALPDIGSLEASLPAAGRSRASRRAGHGASAQEAMRSLAVQEDPSTLARAIRTVLKREEKG